jgi:hypothetical protein
MQFFFNIKQKNKMIKYFILTFPVENLEQLIATKCFISIKNWLKNVFIVCLQGIFKSMLNQNWV